MDEWDWDGYQGIRYSKSTFGAHNETIACCYCNFLVVDIVFGCCACLQENDCLLIAVDCC